MKKLICGFIAMLAFIFGLGIYYIYPLIIPISLDELRKNEKSYKSRRFKVFGKLEVIKFADTPGYSINLKDYENDCKDRICFKGLELTEEIKSENILLIDELATKNKTREVTNSIEGEYLAEVEVTGKLVEKGESPFGGGMIYSIKAEKIEQISPIKFVPVEEIMHGK